MKKALSIVFLSVLLALPCAAQTFFEGMANWYNSSTNNLLASHATLPFGTWLLITNPANGKQVSVQVGGRIASDPRGQLILSVSPAAATELGMNRSGMTRLRVSVIRRRTENVVERRSGTARRDTLSAGNRQKQLVLLTWPEMFPQEIIDEFRRETGIEVIYKACKDDGGNEEMLATLRSSHGVMYDLVIADDYMVDFAVREGLARKLDKRRISNFSNINPTFQFQFYDPDNNYTVPYGAGIQTIVYDPSRISKKINRFNDLWDSTLKGSVGLVSNYRVINGLALKSMGKSYNSEAVAEINSAGQKLQKLAPNVRLLQDTGLKEALMDGTISAAVMYTDAALSAVIENPNLVAAFPEEGIGFGIMAAFIPSRAPNADAAMRFLNFILEPRRGAACFEHLMYYCTYSASENELSPELKDVLVLPDLWDFEMMENVPYSAETAHVNVWNRFKAMVPNGR
ncbi:MAG: extracellular solute-binding protein [Spirochaetales bacterium]|nr:extracellular solute-binding protein [Spirochaetales bacterium]